MKIEVKTLNHDSYAHTITIMCGGFSAAEEQLYVVAAQSEALEEGTEGVRQLLLEADECHHFRAIVYFVPQVIPQGKGTLIADHPPFDAQVTITSAEGKTIYNKQYSINQWGGAAIEIKL